MREITTHRVDGVDDGLQVQTDDGKLTAGGAPTAYWITCKTTCDVSLPGATNRVTGSGPGGSPVRVLWDLRFQDGPVREAGVNGITQEALLAVVIDRLEKFQDGPFACVENYDALVHLRSALGSLQARTRDRRGRGVEGTPEK